MFMPWTAEKFMTNSAMKTVDLWDSSGVYKLGSPEGMLRNKSIFNFKNVHKFTT